VTCSRKTIWFTLLGIYRATVVLTVAAMRCILIHFVICNLYLSGTSVRLALKFVTQKYWDFMEVIYPYIWELLYPEDGGSQFLRNARTYLRKYASSQRRNSEDSNISLLALFDAA